MAKELPEIVKITLDTSRLKDKDSEGNTLNSYKNILKFLDTDLRGFERVLQSATNSFEYFNNAQKTINPSSGLASQSFYIQKSDLDNAVNALKSKIAELSVTRGESYNLNVADAELVQATKTVYGKKAQRKAIEEIGMLGGTVTVNPSNPDKLNIVAPFSSKELEGLTFRQRSALVTQAMPESAKLSKIESGLRREEEQKKIEKEKQAEEKKANALAEKERNFQEKEEAKRKKEQEKAEERQLKAEVRADQKYLQDEIRKKDEEDKKTEESARKITTVTKAILGTLIIIGDIVRRLLTASLQQASENHRLATDSHAVGVTVMQRREYDLFDISRGMEKGTTFNAIQDIQSMFGDITALDEKALGTLARVMGSEVSRLVQSGMGGDNPAVLMDTILDKYFKQFLSGKNSLGQTVGMEQARRELITTLQSVSPSLAQIFSQMADDYSSGYYGKFEDTAGWRATAGTTNRTGLTEAEMKFSTEMGKKYNQILMIVEDLKTSFFTRLANSLEGLLNKITDSTAGMSSENIIQRDRELKPKLQENKRILEQQNTMFNASTKMAIANLASVSHTPVKSGGLFNNYTEAQANRFKYDMDVLAGIHVGKYDKEYFKKNDLYKKYGMTSTSDIHHYLVRAKDVFNTAINSPEVGDELARTIVNMQSMESLNEEIGKRVGSGLKDVSLTSAGQDLKAQELFAGLKNNINTVGKKYAELSKTEQQKVYEAYVQYATDNPDFLFDEIQPRLQKNPNLGNPFQAEQARLMAEEGITDHRLLSKEKKREIFIKASTPAFYEQFYNNPLLGWQRDKALDNYMEATVIEQAINNMDTADSKIMSRLLAEGASFTPRSTYTLSGKQGTSGEYLLTVQLVNERGAKVGSPMTFNMTDTKAGEIRGTLKTDEKGNLSYAIAQ